MAKGNATPSGATGIKRESVKDGGRASASKAGKRQPETKRRQEGQFELNAPAARRPNQEGVFDDVSGAGLRRTPPPETTLINATNEHTPGGITHVGAQDIEPPENA